MPARRTLGASVVAVAVAVALLHHGVRLDAVQKMANYTTGHTAFTQAREYRDSLIPLALPLGAIGLTGGGVAYMVGNAMAQRILGGVVIGLALALLGPSLVA